MRPGSRNDFAIAILCALIVEADAVEALFDETYDRLCEYYGKQPGDANLYINGRIGRHSVVLCSMPGMGKGSAASIASSLLVSYPGIQLALVVGICGGAPYTSSNQQIFLGDVVLSNAVIEYDFGKQYPAGFRRKTDVQDTLGRPNREMRTLLASLQASRTHSEFREQMLHHLQTLQHSEARWRHPGLDDVLFEASYLHRHYGQAPPAACCCCEVPHDICEDALQKNCNDLGCNTNQVIRRRRHGIEEVKTSIYTGAIASADTVMKSGEHRDTIIRNEKVIGFEMEGAGVRENISCIIIKGVCDYADSHKNKAWQAYAAAAGAAAAKAFLGYWNPVPKGEAKRFHVPLDLTAVPAIEEFVGRQDDLARLWDYLQPASSQSRKVAILHGLGGIGKTQLAIHFARNHKNDFTAIFWLSGKNESALVQSLSSCLPRIQGQAVDIEVTTEEEAKQRARQVLKWLATPENSRWLMIFDNVDQYSPLQDSNQCGYDVLKFFPEADHGSILITSRLQRLTELGRPFKVQRLSEQDAVQLLLQSSELSATDTVDSETKQDIMDLTDRLGGLSLAIVIAGAFMRETGTSMKEYLKYYKDSWVDLQSRSGPTRHYQQGNMLETWLVTYREVQKRDPTAAMLLLLLACFDNRDFWYELVQCGLNCLKVPDWYNKAVFNGLAFKASLKTLIGFSLIETKQQGGSYSMHPVVQDWCHHIAAAENHTMQLAELALVSIAHMVPSLDERDFTRLQQRLLPHADYLTHRGEYNWLENSNAILEALQSLGILYHGQGALDKAEEVYQRVLTGFEKAGGPHNTLTLGTIQNLGLVYQDQGKLKKAEEMLQQAITGFKKLLGPDHTLTLTPVQNLGTLYNSQGKLKEAEEIYQKALKGLEKVLGSDLSATMGIFNNLGALYISQGRLKEAEEMLRKALKGEEKALGPDHISSLDTVNNLGTLYFSQGKLQEAEEMLQQALTGKKKVSGPNHLSTLGTVNILGILYFSQGKLQEAEEMLQQALRGYKKTLGLGCATHSSALNTMNNLGLLYKTQGKLKEAEHILHQALRGYEEILGPGHSQTQVSALILASVIHIRR